MQFIKFGSFIDFLKSQSKKENSFQYVPFECVNMDALFAMSEERLLDFVGYQDINNILFLASIAPTERKSLVMREVAKNYYYMTQDNVKKMDYDTMHYLLSLDTYPSDEQILPDPLYLEEKLFLIFGEYVVNNPELTTDKFLQLAKLVRLECLSPTFIAKFCEMKEFKTACDSDAEFAKKCYECLSRSVLDPTRRDMERARKFEPEPKPETEHDFLSEPEPKTETEPKAEISSVKYDDIKVGEDYDVLDKNGSWYVARAEEKQENSVKFSFYGWRSCWDETISFDKDTQRVFPVKTNTNGVKHDGEGAFCGCFTCEKARGRKVFEPRYECVKYDDVQVGSDYDVKDFNDKWYVAKALQKSNYKVEFEFYGWLPSANEIIGFCPDNKNSQRVSALGSKTNGVKHTRGKCECVSCQDKTSVKTSAKTSVKTSDDKPYKQEFKSVKYEDIQVGNDYDVMDGERLWYVARALEKRNDAVVFSYYGWSDKFNDVINFNKGTSLRVSELGSMTNGVKHIRDRLCKCVACQCKDVSDEEVRETFNVIGEMMRALMTPQ